MPGARWDELVLGLVVLALIAVIVANSNTTSAIQQIGAALAKLSQNIVGTGQGSGQ